MRRRAHPTSPADRGLAGGGDGAPPVPYRATVAALFAAQFAIAIVPFGIGALAPFLRDAYDLQRSQVGLAALSSSWRSQLAPYPQAG